MDEYSIFTIFIFGIEFTIDNYNFFADPRTADWFLSGKLGHLLVILVTYVYFCTKAGPRFMKDRKPYDLKAIIQVYNIIQIFASTYLVYVVSDFKLKCLLFHDWYFPELINDVLMLKCIERLSVNWKFTYRVFYRNWKNFRILTAITNWWIPHYLLITLQETVYIFQFKHLKFEFEKWFIIKHFLPSFTKQRNYYTRKILLRQNCSG